MLVCKRVRRVTVQEVVVDLLMMRDSSTRGTFILKTKKTSGSPSPLPNILTTWTRYAYENNAPVFFEANNDHQDSIIIVDGLTKVIDSLVSRCQSTYECM